MRIPVKNDRGFPAIFTTRTFGHRKFLKSPKIPEFRNSSLKLYNTYGFKQEFRNSGILELYKVSFFKKENSKQSASDFCPHPMIKSKKFREFRNSGNSGIPGIPEIPGIPGIPSEFWEFRNSLTIAQWICFCRNSGFFQKF